MFKVIIFFRNYWLKYKFYRKRIQKKRNFRIKRCTENKNKIYIIDTKKKKLYHIFDQYTCNELDFESTEISREKCFSRKNYLKRGYKEKEIRIVDLNKKTKTKIIILSILVPLLFYYLPTLGFRLWDYSKAGPGVEIEEIYTNKYEDDQYSNKYRISLQSDYPIASLFIITPARLNYPEVIKGRNFTGWTEERGNYKYRRIDQAIGIYEIALISEEEEELKTECLFENGSARCAIILVDSGNEK